MRIKPKVFQWPTRLYIILALLYFFWPLSYSQFCPLCSSHIRNSLRTLAIFIFYVWHILLSDIWMAKSFHFFILSFCWRLHNDLILNYKPTLSFPDPSYVLFFLHSILLFIMHCCFTCLLCYSWFYLFLYHFHPYNETLFFFNFYIWNAKDRSWHNNTQIFDDIKNKVITSIPSPSLTIPFPMSVGIVLNLVLNLISLILYLLLLTLNSFPIPLTTQVSVILKKIKIKTFPQP